jgi:MarR family transcriptional regulator, transcriptional regulator for hemolysin
LIVSSTVVPEAAADDDFFHEFGAATVALRQAFARRVGLSSSRVQVLLWLKREGETRHSELRERLGADGATVTRLVKQFESEGLLSRRPDPSDNRYTLATLTKAGREVAHEVERSHQLFQAQLICGVSDRDRQAVVRVLRRFRANATLEKE